MLLVHLSSDHMMW